MSSDALIRVANGLDSALAVLVEAEASVSAMCAEQNQNSRPGGGVYNAVRSGPSMRRSGQQAGGNQGEDRQQSGHNHAAGQVRGQNRTAKARRSNLNASDLGRDAAWRTCWFWCKETPYSQGNTRRHQEAPG